MGLVKKFGIIIEEFLSSFFFLVLREEFLGNIFALFRLLLGGFLYGRGGLLLNFLLLLLPLGVFGFFLEFFLLVLGHSLLVLVFFASFGVILGLSSSCLFGFFGCIFWLYGLSFRVGLFGLGLFFSSLETESLSDEFDSVREQGGLRELAVLDDISDLCLRELEEDIFRLEVSMDDSAESVEEIKTYEYLSGNFSAEVKRDTLVVVSLDDFQEIDTEDFEDKAEVVSVGSFVDEGVEELNNLAIVFSEILFVFIFVDFFESIYPFFFLTFSCYSLKNFHLIVCSLEVMSSRFLDF